MDSPGDSRSSDIGHASRIEALRERVHPRQTPLVRLVVALVVLVVLVGSVGACERRPRFELLSVREVSTNRLDAGRSFFVVGEGFPVGRPLDVVLVGTTSSPLGRRTRVRHALAARAHTPEIAEVRLTDADVERLGGRGTFAGSIEVVAAGAPIDGFDARLVGVLEDVVLDVVPSLHRLETHGRDVLALGPLLGISFDVGSAAAGGETDGPGLDAASVPGQAGLVVREVAPDGAARRLGLVEQGLDVGARVVALDGMRLLDPGEFAVAPDTRTCELRIALANDETRVLIVDVDRALGRRRAASYRYDQFAAIVLVAAVLFGAWPRPQSDTRPRDELRPGSVLLSLGALATSLIASTNVPSAVSPWPYWLGLGSFLRLCAAFARVRGVRSTTGPGEDAVAVLGAVGAAVAVGALAMVTPMPGAAGPVWLPVSWPLLRTPVGPTALLALAATAGATPRRVAWPEDRSGRLARGLDDLGLALVSSALVRVAVADPGALHVGTRATGLVATILAFLGALVVRSAAAACSLWARASFVVVSSGFTLAAMALWLGLPSDANDERAVSEVVLVVFGLLVVRVATLGIPNRQPSPGRPRDRIEGPLAYEAGRKRAQRAPCPAPAPIDDLARQAPPLRR